ncbi:MAG: alpha/beta hydrolase [Firmicutes bacterium]|nr:alpha/beta hydrolase [Bacillota bacterium]
MEKSNLKYTGELKENVKTVLFIAGNAGTPEVYDDIPIPEGWQRANLHHCLSPGPWDVDSMGKRIALFVEEHNLGPTVLVGYSLGGALSVSAAIHGGSRIAGLLLSNTGLCTENHGDPNVPDKIRSGKLTLKDVEAMVDANCIHPIPEKLRQKMIDYTVNTPLEMAYEGALSLRQTDLREAAKAIKCPVTIAHGKLDKRRSEYHVQQMKESMPQANVVMLEGSHSIMLDDPEGFTAALTDLLNQI